jgi:hypothetical protein
LKDANKSSLIKATLETLLRFLNWIPLGYIFETQVIDLLLNRVRLVFLFKHNPSSSLLVPRAARVPERHAQVPRRDRRARSGSRV